MRDIRNRVVHAGRERGAALVMALVILLILTLLGITAMGTSSLQEKMAGNIQESTRSFEAAESGLVQALNDASALNLNASTTKGYTFDSGKSGSATVVTSFVDFSDLPRKQGAIYGNTWQGANFDQVSTGTTLTGAKSVIHQGVVQIVPKTN